MMIGKVMPPTYTGRRAESGHATVKPSRSIAARSLGMVDFGTCWTTMADSSRRKARTLGGTPWTVGRRELDRQPVPKGDAPLRASGLGGFPHRRGNMHNGLT
jgi:hypothetical protein